MVGDHEVPVLLLFHAYGLQSLDDVCELVQRTAPWADVPTLCGLLYATEQHTAGVVDRMDALRVLIGAAPRRGPARCRRGRDACRTPAVPRTRTPGTPRPVLDPIAATEDLLVR